MSDAKQLLEKRYIHPIQENPKLYIGVELEYPIVNKQRRATDIQVARHLMDHIHEQLDFQIEKRDKNGAPIQLVHENGDCILFEVSYNTLEFAFAKAITIQEVDERLTHYLSVIQTFLGLHHHELQGEGINPNWDLNDNHPVCSPRYQMLMQFLELGNTDKTRHSYPEYGAFICGNQVQLDVSRDNVLRVLRLFDSIEPVKAYLFANSPFPTAYPETRIARDIFWEQSMHGRFEENVGIYKKQFHTFSDYLEYLGRTALFTAERNGEVYYFEPIRAKDYLQQSQIQAKNLQGERKMIQPEEKDFDTHRSYHYQELTTRGTVEFRSVCTQPFDKTFYPIAFQLGLFVNLEQAESLVRESPFYCQFGQDNHQLRRQFSKTVLSPFEAKAIKKLAAQLLDCSIEGLKQRGFGEERYLSVFDR